MPIASMVISGISCIVAALALVRNTRSDTKKDAGQMTEIIVKLEMINDNVKEVKADMRDFKADSERVKERLIIVEESLKSAHKRIDRIHADQEAEGRK